MQGKLSRTNLILYSFGLIPVVWLGLLVAPAITNGGIVELVKNLGNVFNNPFSITICGGSLKNVLILIFAYVLGIGKYITTARNYRRREEHGSAKWGRLRNIMQTYTQYPEESNKILTQNVCIGYDAKAQQFDMAYEHLKAALALCGDYNHEENNNGANS